MSDADRIAALERKNLALENRIAALERRPLPATSAAPPQRVVEPEGARILHQQAGVTIASPNAKERSALAGIVIGKYKFLAPDASSTKWGDRNVTEWNNEFEAALMAVGAFGRGEIDTKVYVSSWIDRAEDFLRAQPLAPTTTITLAPFLAACLSFGVTHTLVPSRWPHDILLGLTAAGADGPAASASDWQSVLRLRRLPDALPLPPARTSQASRVSAGPTW
jgi:hypothetical protein